MNGRSGGIRDAIHAVLFMIWCMGAQNVSALPILLDIAVHRATVYDTASVTSVPDFDATVIFDLSGSLVFAGINPGGGLNSTWDMMTPLEFASTSPYEALLQSYSGLPLGQTQRRAIVGEWPNGPPSVNFPNSTAFLSSISIDRSLGLFSMELIGESETQDQPGLDASDVPDNVTFLALLRRMESLKFAITGYGLSSTGGFTQYGQVIGNATIRAAVTVSEPPLLPLTLQAVVLLALYRCQRVPVATMSSNARAGRTRPCA